MHRRIVMLSILAAAAWLPSRSATAQVLFSTYGPGDTYSGAFIASNFAGYGRNAARFVPSITGFVDQAETSISRIGPPFPSLAATVSIVPEVLAAGGPGGSGPQPGVMAVWCATATSAPLDQRNIYRFTGPRATLIAGQAYWLVLDASDQTSWYYAQPPVLGTTAFRNGSPWITQPNAMLPAFRVSTLGGPPLSGACCNGATGGCTVIEGPACGTLGLTFSGAGTTCGTGPITCHACPADFDHSGGLSVQDIFDFLGAWFAGCP